jgi:hypothetical protein
MTDWNDGTNHGWNGGDCPVHPETVVEYWLRGGGAGERVAKRILWDHSKSVGDVVAFRVVKPYVEPKVIWINEYTDGRHVAHTSEGDARKWATLGSATRIAVKYVEAKE